MQRLITVLDGFSRTTGNLLRWLALAMLLAQFLIVIARYVFG
jgi:TRAP-type mannitol/chloroaromatic compound transport system permease small subunit